MPNTKDFDFDVLIVGGGPVGMLLASELRISRAEPVVLERLAERTPHSKAFGLHARSLESLDRRGLVERFRDGARSWNNGHFAGLDVWVDFSLLDSAHNYALLSEQTRTERLLEERAQELGVPVRRGHEVSAVRQDADGAEVDVTGPEGSYTLRGRYVVGTDGGRSLVRRSAGIGFPGTGGRVTARLADVVLADREKAPMGMERTERGLLFCVPLDEKYHRVATFDFQKGKEAGTELTLEEFTDSLREIWGDDLGAGEPRWLSWFTARPSAIARGASSWPVTPRTRTSPSAARASTSACRTSSTSAGSWLRRSTAGRRRACSTRTTRSARRRPATCWPTPARRSR
jgi:2-polyprenyl-6-methoxyphenol hydroxylase-like FAD-dependent oxidoreductase